MVGYLPKALGKRRAFVDKFQVFDQLSVPSQNAAERAPVPHQPLNG